MSRLLIGLATVLLLAQCQERKAQEPRAEGFDPPIPPALSYVAGPVTFNIEEIQRKINEKLDPVLIGKETEKGKPGGLFSFRVKRMGSVQVQYVDHQIKLSAPLQIWLTKPFSNDTTPPKKPFCLLHVGFKSPISVTPDWRFASHTTFADYKWLIKPEVKVLGKEFSLASVAQHILENYKTTIEQAIDTAVYHNLRLDEMVRPTWEDLQKPLLINKEYGLWLLPKPISIAAGPIDGNAKQLVTHLRIAFETQTELKPQEPKPARTPLPRLQKRDSVSQTSDLHVLSFIPYADINRMLALTMGKKPKDMALGAVTVKGASVYGAQHALIVKAELSGLIDGPVYLRGRPVFDTLTNTLMVKDLDFDTSGEDVLSKSTGAVWHKALRSVLENMLTIPLGGDIARLPQVIRQAYEKGGPGEKTDLGIETFRFVPQKIAIRPDGIQTLINVKSKVGVKVNKM